MKASRILKLSLYTPCTTIGCLYRSLQTTTSHSPVQTVWWLRQFTSFPDKLSPPLIKARNRILCWVRPVPVLQLCPALQNGRAGFQQDSRAPHGELWFAASARGRLLRTHGQRMGRKDAASTSRIGNVGLSRQRAVHATSSSPLNVAEGLAAWLGQKAWTSMSMRLWLWRSMRSRSKRSGCGASSLGWGMGKEQAACAAGQVGAPGKPGLE